MHYSICAPADAAAASILAAAVAALDNDQQMRADRAKLECSCTVQLYRIPEGVRHVPASSFS
jgi:hypothetical protein